MTPVKGKGSFFAGAFERPAARLFAAGVGVLHVNGPSGEGLLEAIEQPKRVTGAGEWHVGGCDGQSRGVPLEISRP